MLVSDKNSSTLFTIDLPIIYITSNTLNSLKYVGNQTHNSEDIYVGMSFKSKEAFKQHMSMYAIKKKFRFRTSRSAPEGMVLTCFSTTCSWRVYATRLKNVEMYEIRKLVLDHSCSVDDRSGINRLIIQIFYYYVYSHFSNLANDPHRFPEPSNSHRYW